jgi:dTDP-4-amino-4,6-dideoxygalactose transaminase
VIEDAACAIGSELLWDGHWERVGKPHADIACFSFHPRKLLSTGDGGMLTTRDQKLDATFRLLRQHGMTVPDTVRHASSQVVFEEYSVPAYNYRMTDIQAAIGREQLKRLPAIVERRRTLAPRMPSISAVFPVSFRPPSRRGRAPIGKATPSACRRRSNNGASCSAFWTRVSPRGAV